TAVNGIGIQLINVEVYLSCLQEGRSLTIKLRKRKTEKKVEWSSDTVDNEHLGRRSSKCEQKCDPASRPLTAGDGHQHPSPPHWGESCMLVVELYHKQYQCLH
uniref:E3 ubiquitin-protein ligase PPP1R11 n=1 Tax=Poecilia mexicana TaxID=48701 RepID=A0A3B3X4G0_9TELE